MQFIIFLLPLLAIFLMMRSQKKRQAQMQSMQTALQPGSGVRTIGGMYALVKAVNDETVELEVAPGVVAHYTKGAIAAVLEPLEYDAIINGRPAEDESDEAVEALDAAADEKPLSLSKDEAKDEAKVDAEAPESK
ncbi:preprotein translocase subunit YajC [Kitasatospora sp. YST-16]|uniref:preprotein translocase subunit YajC n=1 Tax=unclassified Kitasatospora TaxID=2633591 RepID=UPI000B0A9481|nr:MULTISPECIES: preprotein translocase subunit YajC [unclassified Kitasatospora]WAL70802.1 preprotein translocase subunit YajC [Kitasatospora sp. YST-16]WNW36839.1 preprotein translocase subunit YajC [Streptomyces sp. Li-HN-5-13]